MVNIPFVTRSSKWFVFRMYLSNYRVFQRTGCFRFELNWCVWSPFFRDMSVVGGTGRFLTLWRSLEGFRCEQVVFKKTRLCWKSSGKIVKNVSHCQTMQNPNHWIEKNRYCVFFLKKKNSKPHVSTQYLFHRHGYVWNDFFELDINFLPKLSQLKIWFVF